MFIIFSTLHFGELFADSIQAWTKHMQLSTHYGLKVLKEMVIDANVFLVGLAYISPLPYLVVSVSDT